MDLVSVLLVNIGMDLVSVLLVNNGMDFEWIWSQFCWLILEWILNCFGLSFWIVLYSPVESEKTFNEPWLRAKYRIYFKQVSYLPSLEGFRSWLFLLCFQLFS